MLDLGKTGFPEHAVHLIGREECGEIDIPGSGKLFFLLCLGSGHYEGKDDFRAGRATRGPPKGVVDRGRREKLRHGEPGYERGRFCRKTCIRQRIGERLAFEVARREPKLSWDLQP
jgi:hypothetical protein